MTDTNRTTADRARSEQITAFYAAHSSHLRGLVYRRSHAPAHVVDDACQHAWTTLVRRPDITLDAQGLSWLVLVAVHEAWRLGSIAREKPAGDLHGPATDSDEQPEPAAPDDRSAADRALERIEHQERLQLLATLKPRERQALYLHGLGYTYHEIAKLSRGVCVNVAVLLGADVGDMSLTEASRPPFVRSEASGGAPAVAAFASKEQRGGAPVDLRRAAADRPWR